MHDELRHHLDEAVHSRRATSRAFAARLSDPCWPGGVSDRFSAPAARWLASWRPQKLGGAVLTCSCDTGRCGICN